MSGPAGSVEELNSILETKRDIAEQIIRSELAYYRDAHKADIIALLFKLNKITHEERLTNCCKLLSAGCSTSSILLPNKSDALAVTERC